MARRQHVEKEAAVEKEEDEFYPPAVGTGIISEGGHELSFPELIDEVIAGKWGVGQERRRRLAQAGFDHIAVRDELVRRANGR